ncbi:GMC oxidoreductase [Paraburkholderia sp. MM5384-R2]|uniref:GMC oxidoreductase n=1 Tax=Paraburkholderia sp. MM5384-R2 TaxID=2723097 RepID=UPI0017AF0C75|nr:GMC family oxidoreductase [Paraburkholderia sp. MM5384-R2]MBB5498794.1 cholesterol oxidase [Paraburkholderia sp. MM5384-R2]
MPELNEVEQILISTTFDFDWIIIGSGFGGSVSALRLAEKGYRVGVVERGRRYQDKELPKSAWQFKRYFWAPALGLKGIMRMSLFRHVFFPSQIGVGGGSTVYGGVLYRAKPEFFENEQWRALGSWDALLQPHYDAAERMLGVRTVPFDSPAQELARKMARHFAVEDTVSRAPVGVFFGESGKTVKDPYFGGEGPNRTGCTRCGACLVGCRVGAINSLVKNYLWFAEKRGVRILAEREVVDVIPVGAQDGSEGYRVTTQRPGAWFARDRQTYTTRGVVFAGGALGTNELLANCKHGGSLPRVSDRLGELVRTNSESILTVRLPRDCNTWNDVTASSSVHVSHDTHIEFLTYGRNADFLSLLYTVLVGNGTRLTRPLRWFGRIVLHPVQWLKTLWPVGWSRRTVMLLVMQALDNAIALRARKRWLGRGYRLITEQNSYKPNPTYIEVGNRAAQWLARHTGGIAQSNVLEALANIPTTAHVLGGAVIGADAASGVIDRHLCVFGYRNLLVCDGAAMPANPGVNPALTITALAEYAMQQIPAAGPTRLAWATESQTPCRAAHGRH